jgi:hypothetical protein
VSAAATAHDVKPFTVLARRHDGTERVYMRYRTIDEAERIAAALRKVGCLARVAYDELPLEPRP